MVNLKVQTIKVDTESPFENDYLHRKDEIENLTPLLQNINTPLVMAINSPWGSGKTTFIKMWSSYLNSQDIENICFNVWETDFSPDPLLTFISELDERFNENEKVMGLWNEAKQIVISLTKNAVYNAVRSGTAGVVDLEKVKLESSSLISQYKEHKNAIFSFKLKLQKILALLDEPFIIFVDELDRCKPDYAISLLEKIKHFFDVEGIIFILSLDKVQLAYGINGVYGQNFDSKKYLDRFIDFDYSLNDVDYSYFIGQHLAASDIFTNFFASRKEYNAFKDEEEYLCDTIILLTRQAKMTLRDIEQYLLKVNIAICATKKNVYLYPALMAFLIFLKDYNRPIFENYINENNNEEQAVSFLKSLFPEEYILAGRDRNHALAIIEGFLILAKSEYYGYNNSSTVLNMHKKILDDHTNHNYDQVHYSRVVNAVVTERQTLRSVSMQSLVSRINMIEQFSFSPMGSS